MFNFYLSKIGYETASPIDIEDNFTLLNEIVVECPTPEDSFLKNENIYDFNTKDGVLGEIVFSKFNDLQFASTAVPKLLESLQSIPEEFMSLYEFDSSGYRIYNSFWGAKFTVPDERHISEKEAYEKFKRENLWDLKADTFWKRREQLFSNIILCPNVEHDLRKIGGAYLPQIKNRLMALDQYVAKYWENGKFQYNDANMKSSLTISPESTQTMRQAKYYNQRIFKLPDGRKECFELHIKVGALRFHFFPEDRKIYIGYIGKHLDTVDFN